MKLGQIHYDFWMEHQHQPRWAVEARGLARRQALLGRQGYAAEIARDSEEARRLQVEKCINAHASIKLTNGEISAFNLLSFCKNHRGDIANFLTDFIERNYAVPPSQTRRKFFALKWLTRIERNRTSSLSKVA